MKRIAFIFSLFFYLCTAAQTKKVNVYVFVAEDCPVSIYMTKTLKTISESFSASAGFYLVFPMQSSSAKKAETFRKKYGLTGFTNKIDYYQSLAQKLGATITPEVVVTDDSEKILYRGRINDAYAEPGKRKHIYTTNDLEKALGLITNGQPVPTPWKPAVGCYITFIKNKTD